MPLIAPAIANLVGYLTGKRPRHLPMLTGRVQAALKSEGSKTRTTRQS